MIEDELVKIWQSSPNQERVKFEKSRLLVEVQSNLDQLYKSIKYRELLDTLSILVVVPAFSFAVFFVPFPLSKIASGLIACWSVYVFFRMQKAKKNKPKTFTGTYLDYLYKSRQFLLDQKQLLDTVLYWAVIPFIIFTSLFFVGFMERPGATVTRTIGLCGGNVILGVIVFFMNKWAVKKQIMPGLEKVEKLIKEMEKE